MVFQHENAPGMSTPLGHGIQYLHPVHPTFSFSLMAVFIFSVLHNLPSSLCFDQGDGDFLYQTITKHF
jgi:hypothetical protein